LFLNLPVRRGFLGTERADAEAVATTALRFSVRLDADGVMEVTL
jgi:hypothetical protein